MSLRRRVVLAGPREAGARTLGVVARALTLAVAIAAGACGDASHLSAAQWSEQPAAIAQATGNEVAAMLRQCHGTVGIGTLRAAVFPRGVAEPDTTAPEWTTLVADVDEVAAAAKSCDWVLTVVGYADATGTDAINQRISDERASVSAAAIATAVGYPHNLVAHRGVGSVGPGTSADDRKVEVSFTHA